MDMKSILEKINQLEEAKPDFLDVDKDGDKKEPMKKALKDKEEKKDDKEKVEEAIAVQADGEEAMSLLNLLKLAGQPTPEPVQHTEPVTVVTSDAEMAEEERDPSYANTPDEETCGMDAATPGGMDLNKPKTMTKHGYQQGDNPMAMREEVKKLEGKLAKMFESMSKE